MEDELTLRILSPDGQVLESSRLQEVIVPLADGGPIGIRPKHAPLIAETVAGKVKILKPGEIVEVELFSGLLTVRDNIITILTTGELEEPNDQVGTAAEAIDQLTEALEEEERKKTEEAE
jgi:F0F1-type ATP synthase epsilon subunit